MINKGFLDFLNDEFKEAQSEFSKNGEMEKILEEMDSSEARYQFIEHISSGGMKSVDKVQDRYSGRMLAMASVKNNLDDSMREYFLRECRVTSNLQHPSIMPIYDVGVKKSGEPFFVMKLVEGCDLKEHLKKDVSLADRLDIFTKICEAVSFAHSKGVVHLDLKPDNVCVGQHGVVLVCDWGVSKVLYAECDELLISDDKLDSSNLNLTLQNRGTPGYMAPEQYTKKDPLGKQTDIYSLGALLYYLLCFHVPVKGDSIKEYKANTLTGSIDLPSGFSEEVPLSLEAVCMKALEIESTKRYQSVDQILTEINAYQRGFAVHAEKASLAKQLKLLYFRNRAVANNSLVFLILIASGTVYFIISLTQKEQKTLAAYNELSKEVTLRQNAERETAQVLLNESRDLLKIGNVGEAEIKLNQAMLYEIDEAVISELACKIYLLQQEYLKAMEQVPNLENEALKNLCEKIAKTEDSIDRGVLAYAHVSNNDQQAIDLIERLFKKFNREDKIRLLKGILTRINPKLLAEDIVYSYEAKTLTVRSAGLKHFPPIKGLKIVTLDLGGSGITDTSFLNSMMVNNLNISHSKIGQLAANSLSKMRLINLDLSHSTIPFVPVNLFNVRTLNISGCNIRDYKRLYNLNKLNQLIVDRGQLPHDVSKRMEKLIKYKK